MTQRLHRIRSGFQLETRAPRSTTISDRTFGSAFTMDYAKYDAMEADEESAVYNHMDQVVPNLWVGDIHSATDTETLRAKNIHSVLSAMRGKVSIHPVCLVSPNSDRVI
jgi:hypothetical protein